MQKSCSLPLVCVFALWGVRGTSAIFLEKIKLKGRDAHPFFRVSFGSISPKGCITAHQAPAFCIVRTHANKESVPRSKEKTIAEYRTKA